jgi:MoxR-like ATPase
MLLEDGRFLVSAKRFDALLKTHSEEELKNLKLVKVHQDFQVIALGLPVPRFEGNLLDPPLRSRFQARDVRISATTQYQIITSLVPNVPAENVKKLINYAEALRTMQNVNDPSSAVLSTSKMLYLADSAILDVCRVLALFPHASLRSLLFRVHPVELTMDSTERQAIEVALSTLQVTGVKSASVKSKDHVPDLDDNYQFLELRPTVNQNNVQQYSAVFKSSRDKSPVEISILGGHAASQSGTTRGDNIKWQRPFIETPYFSLFISTVLQDHAIDTDVCLIGGKGSGKTALIDEFAKKLNYNTFTIQLYKDMSARDLLQRRSTNQSGDTVWIDSPIVQAAKTGSLLVLDGIHRLAPGTLSIVQRLIQERELNLPDGSYLMRSERFDELVQQLAKSNDAGLIRSVREQLSSQKIFAIHPSFRIVALAEPPGKIGPSRWLNSEISSMFHFHVLRGIDTVDKFQMLEKMFPGLTGRSKDALKVLFNLVAKLDQYAAGQQNRSAAEEKAEQIDASLLYSDVPQLSLRQLIRICKKITRHPNDMYNALENTLLTKFLPIATRRALETIIEESSANTFVQKRVGEADPIKIIIDEDVIRIDDISCARNKPQNPALVPDILFFEVPKHVEILKEMLKDYQLGEHILLIGNQGVGKNVLSDRLLQMLRIEREYIQLHRDTTVQTLTLFPSIHNGVLVWEDSPLVRAVREGRTLVVDEADKAPLEVVIILKGLVEDGEMLLSDGRRILRLSNYSPEILDSLPENVVPMHPEFRMIVLANRPGFPFLGNNFFRECGDCFSSHIVDNPDRESEIKLLQGYGPHVDPALVQRLVSLFGDLRSSVDQGLLSYPYSLRELVNIVKHLEAFPNDTISQTIENVFDFDNYDTNLKQYLGSLFNRHGIPLTGGSFTFKVKLADEIPLPRPIPTEVIKKKQIGSDVKMPLNCPVVTTKLEPKGNWPYEANRGLRNKSLMQSRAQVFTEEVCNWQVETKGSILGMTNTSDGRLHVLVSNPFQVLSYTPSFEDYEVLQLADHMHFSSPFSSYANIYANSENSEIMGTQTDDSFALYRTGGASSLTVRRYLPPAAIISALDDDSYVLFIASLNMVIKIDPIRKLVQPFALPDLTRQNSGPLFAVFGKRVFANVRQATQTASFSGNNQRQVFMLDTLASKGILVFLRKYAADFAVMNFAKQQSTVVSIPIEDFEIETIQFIETNWWLIIEKTRKNVLLNWKQSENKFELYFIDMKVFNDRSREDLYKTIPTTIREHYFASMNTIPNYFNNIYTYLQFSSNPVAAAIEKSSNVFIESFLRPMEDRKRALHSQHLRKTNQVLNLCLKPEKQEAATKQERDSKLVLELVDLEKRTVRALEILPSEAVDPSSKLNSAYLPVSSSSGSRTELFKIVAFAELPNGDLVTVQENGQVRVWEVDVKRLNAALKQWQKIIGQDLVKSDDNSLKVTYDYDGKKEATGPKYGKVDTTGESHTGGNTWAGGTGGANTAGMGGKGGPYRLDAGHDVAQISKEEKAKVSKEVTEAARAMAKAALEQRLREINMNEFEAQKYIRYVAPVQFEIKQLRAILEAAQAKGKEREWGRMKSTGELDDTRLVEGITGDRNVYKIRENQKPRFGSPQEKPKRMRFVMDISGSMYRFNSQDKRLDRLLQVTAMIMESLQGFEQKFSYSIVGHSGDSPEIPLVEYDKPPKNAKERLQILEKMSAHSQYCSSGDTTVQATQWAIRNIVREEADEHFVFVFSDANLSRYDIKPQELAIELMRDARVRAYAIFIASLVDEAEQLKKGLPLGRGYVCLDPGAIPLTFKQIFAEQTLDSDY